MLPNWYGIESIGFEWRGSQNDPILHYKGHRFSGTDIQDAMWDTYRENGGDPDSDSEWKHYVIDNAVDYLEDLILAMEGE